MGPKATDSKTARRKLRRAAVAVTMLAVVASAQACSTQSSSPPPDTTASSTTAAPAPQAQNDEPDSVLGAGAHFVWTVVAFPFRLVGDALGLLV
jgi:hypothetical protein